MYQQLAGWQGKGGFTQLEAADDPCGEPGSPPAHDWPEGSPVPGAASSRFSITNLPGDTETLTCVPTGNPLLQPVAVLSNAAWRV